MRPQPQALLTDLYELSMLQAYYERGIEAPAVFELFVRKLPQGRNFLVAAGLEQALEFVETLRFGDEELSWIERCGLFSRAFVDRLARWRFSGEVLAMPEGTIFFPDEPLLRVTAPLPEAQLLETRVLNLVHFQTLVASKAARCRLAAPGKRLIDFGLRRAHGGEAGLLAARASYAAGFDGTSTVAAAPAFGIPVFGTMAHSFVQAHPGEREAFAAFASVFPENAVLLIDTYDTVAGARKAVEVGREFKVKGVRLDSGDLAMLSRQVREVLDQGGLKEAIIFASGNLDEHRIAALLAAGAPIDAFGVGTSLVTSADHPYLDMVYKLQEYAGKPRRKRSAGKATWPGRKQVYRRTGAGGEFAGDVVSLESDPQPGEALLVPAMAKGRRMQAPSLAAVRERALSQMRSLPAALRSLAPAREYPVRISESVRRLAFDADRSVDAKSASS